MEKNSLQIGERLKEIRKTRGLTLDAVSEMTDVSKPMLGQIERGQASPTINTLWKISNGLKGCRAYESGTGYGGKWKYEGISTVPF